MDKNLWGVPKDPPGLNRVKILSRSRDKKCKGVKKCIAKKTPDFEDYKQCLSADQNTFRKQLLFRNELHEVHTIEVNKLALSRNDDKHVIQGDGVSTLALGHAHKDMVLGIFLGGSKDKKVKGVKKYILKTMPVAEVNKLENDDEERVGEGSLARTWLQTSFNGLDLEK